MSWLMPSKFANLIKTGLYVYTTMILYVIEKGKAYSNENTVTKHWFCRFCCWLMLYRRYDRWTTPVPWISKKIHAKKRHRRRVGWDLEKKTASIHSPVTLSSLCVMDRTVKVSMCSLLVSQRETNIISFKRKKRNRAQSEQAPNCLRIVKTYDYHIVFIWSFYWWQIQTDRLLAFGGKVPSARYLGLI